MPRAPSGVIQKSAALSAALSAASGVGSSSTYPPIRLRRPSLPATPMPRGECPICLTHTTRVVWLVLAVALLLALWVYVGTPGIEPSLPRQSTGTSETEGLANGALPHATPHRREALPTANSGADRGALRLIARAYSGSTTFANLSVLLLPPLKTGHWNSLATRDDVIEACRSNRFANPEFGNDSWQTYAWVRKTNGSGAATFDGLPPSDGYQLRMLEDGIYEFDVRLTPFRKHTKEKAVHINRGFDFSRLADTAISGYLPVFADRISETVVRKHIGSIVKGRVPEGSWDELVVKLARRQDQVQREMGSIENQRDFEFQPVSAGQGYLVIGHAVRGSHHYSFMERFELLPGQIKDLGSLIAIDQHLSHRIHASVADESGRSLDASTVLEPGSLVLLALRRLRPDLRANCHVLFDREYFVHGFRSPEIIYTDFRGRIKSGWRFIRIKEDLASTPGVIGLTLVVASTAESVDVTFELIPPSGLEYTANTYVELRSSATGSKLESLMFTPHKHTASCRLRKGRFIDAILRTESARNKESDIRRLAGSERRVLKLQIQPSMKIVDPGPPNGFGVRRIR